MSKLVRFLKWLKKSTLVALEKVDAANSKARQIEKNIDEAKRRDLAKHRFPFGRG